MTGALIKLATTVILSGDVSVFNGEVAERMTGYNVITGSAGRKQAFHAHEDTHITMIFPTKAKTVQQAEEEFTDEHDRLMSRIGKNEVFIGELV